jgi:hypothetical protein
MQKKCCGVSSSSCMGLKKYNCNKFENYSGIHFSFMLLPSSFSSTALHTQQQFTDPPLKKKGIGVRNALLLLPQVQVGQ